MLKSQEAGVRRLLKAVREAAERPAPPPLVLHRGRVWVLARLGLPLGYWLNPHPRTKVATFDDRPDAYVLLAAAVRWRRANLGRGEAYGCRCGYAVLRAAYRRATGRAG